MFFLCIFAFLKNLPSIYLCVFLAHYVWIRITMYYICRIYIRDDEKEKSCNKLANLAKKNSQLGLENLI